MNKSTHGFASFVLQLYVPTLAASTMPFGNRTDVDVVFSVVIVVFVCVVVVFVDVAVLDDASLFVLRTDADDNRSSVM